MDHGIITALGALLLAFLMGGVAGIALTITILVRHFRRKLIEKGIGEAQPQKAKGVTSMILDEAASSVLDRRPS